MVLGDNTYLVLDRTQVTLDGAFGAPGVGSTTLQFNEDSTYAAEDFASAAAEGKIAVINGIVDFKKKLTLSSGGGQALTLAVDGWLQAFDLKIVDTAASSGAGNLTISQGGV